MDRFLTAVLYCLHVFNSKCAENVLMSFHTDDFAYRRYRCQNDPGSLRSVKIIKNAVHARPVIGGVTL